MRVTVTPEQRDQKFMLQARAVAQMGTCLRGKYGAVLVSPDAEWPFAAGANRAPVGLPHCNDRYPPSPVFDPWGQVVTMERQLVGCLLDQNHCVRTIHAEIRAILQAAEDDNSALVDGSVLYVSGRPCLRCTMVIVQVGIGEVIWPEQNTYHTDSEDDVLATFRAAGVEVRLFKETADA